MKPNSVPCPYGTAMRRSLDLGHAAVDEEFDPGDEAGVVGGQEGDGFGDFVGGAHAAHGNAADESRFELGAITNGLPQAINGRGFDGTGADDVDADFTVLEINGPTAGERAEGGFGGAVHAKGGHAFYGNDGGVENDGGAIDEKRKGFLYGEENAFHIYFESFVVVGLGDRAEGREIAEAGVGEEDVDAEISVTEVWEKIRLTGGRLIFFCGHFRFVEHGRKSAQPGLGVLLGRSPVLVEADIVGGQVG
jgi:hypothetical protein